VVRDDQERRKRVNRRPGVVQDSQIDNVENVLMDVQAWFRTARRGLGRSDR
jgi:hypothetical protein